MKTFVAVVTGILFVLYPIGIWLGLTHFSARTVGLWMLAVLIPGLILRFRHAKREDLLVVARVPIAILAVVSLGIVFDDRRFVLAMPVLTNLVMLATFASSLRAEHTIIERFARMQEKDPLSAGQIAHCRQVTWAWCAFFVFNATISGALALFAPLAWWAAYTSGIAYGLMGAMFAGELVVRRYRFRTYGRGLHDRLLSRIFPPPPGQP
jgi:uncharacterized membrane protein